MMSEEAIWFVMQGEEQLGPYTGVQLTEYAGNGSITRETLIWAEGMETWLPAAQIEGLFPAAAVQVAAAPPTETAAYPPTGVKAASFGTWAWFLVGGILLIIIALVAMGMITKSHEGSETGGGEGMLLAMLGLMGVGYLLTVISVIVFYIYLYRAWLCLQPGGLARSTPGKAIGFLFIPFFNLYWFFQAIHGLSVDWNRTIASYPDLRAIHRLPEGLFLSFCVLALVFPPVNLILIFMVMSHLTTGINSFAYRPKPHTPGNVGFKLG